MANGAVYDDAGGVKHIHDRKLDALEDLIEAANGKPVLVAYWFKHDLARISERLHRLHVSFSQLDTPESIRRWNAGELLVALVHPASAGHGLNLQSGGWNSTNRPTPAYGGRARELIPLWYSTSSPKALSTAEY
jgi:hypothetical protein